MPALQADEILACLERHRVRYVLVGGLAAVLHGSPLPTLDARICPSREPANLERLAAALREMEARIRTPDSPEGLRFSCDARFLEGLYFVNLVTRFGDLDVSFQPAGTRGFPDLEPRAITMTIKGTEVRVAVREDVIRSKEAANRPKDRRNLPVLRQLLDEIEQRRRESSRQRLPLDAHELRRSGSDDLAVLVGHAGVAEEDPPAGAQAFRTCGQTTVADGPQVADL